MDFSDIFRPTIGKITLFIVIALAAIVSILFSTPCNPLVKISGITIYSGSAFTMCTDSPQSIAFFPGMYPPMLFDEKLTYQNEPVMSLQNRWTKSTNSFGFSCTTASCGFCSSKETTITASCSINPIVPFYVIIYWYLIACLIALLLKTKFIQTNGKKIAMVSIFLLLWAVFVLYLISNLINGTWGIRLNLLGIVLVMIPVFVIAYFILVKISS